MIAPTCLLSWYVLRLASRSIQGTTAAIMGVCAGTPAAKPRTSSPQHPGGSCEMLSCPLPAVALNTPMPTYHAGLLICVDSGVGAQKKIHTHHAR